VKEKRSKTDSLLEPYRDAVTRCVKCGSCRAVCPSFLHEERESFSARGRMALVKAVLDGKLTVSEIFKDRLATCTGCLACEAACPSNVPVTEIIQAAKEQAIRESGKSIVNEAVSQVLKHPAALRATAWLAPVALHYVKTKRSEFKVQSLKSGEQSAKYRVHSTRDTKKGRVVFFPGCAIEYFQPDIGAAVQRVLNALGYEVIVPAGLKCCGRPLLSLGDRAAAEELAAHNATVLSSCKADAIVTACASCGLTFKKEYPKLLRPEGKGALILDIHEFLSDKLAGTLLAPLYRSVTIHDPCHLGRGQGLATVVRDVLLCSVPGLELREMKNADRCCGFGGVMRVTHRVLSDGIAEEKARTIIETEADTVVTGCPGCRMQIANALTRAGSNARVLHTVQVLDEALANADCGMRIAQFEDMKCTK
jgi:glycolate dehydrogenase iron-sulfur subunit